MNYRVLIPNNIKRRIAALPSDLPHKVLRRLLSELPSDPNRFLGEVIVPLALRAYHFTEQDDQGATHWFMFAIDGLDPASRPDLRVVDFRETTFDPLADLGPAP